MDKSTLVKVINRGNGRVGYTVQELGVRRIFNKREEKEIPLGELIALNYTNGGAAILRDDLVIKSMEALKEIGLEVEPEYFYDSDDQIKEAMVNSSLDEFLDCLDFAPEGVVERIKNLAVDIELNDVNKRRAILDKTGFNVDRAIEISHTGFDGDSAPTETKSVRRAAAPSVDSEENKPKRRANTSSKYTIV